VTPALQQSLQIGTALTATAAGNLTQPDRGRGFRSGTDYYLACRTVFPPEPLFGRASVPGFAPLQIAQAVPTDSGPDLYSVHVSTDVPSRDPGPDRGRTVKVAEPVARRKQQQCPDVLED